MKIKETEFSKELSELLQKHHCTIEADKSGMYVVTDLIGTTILIGESETASEDSRDKMIFVRGKV